MNQDLSRLDIATLVRLARAKLNVSQTALANMLKVQQKTISNWETGFTTPNAKRFRIILEVLQKE